MVVIFEEPMPHLPPPCRTLPAESRLDYMAFCQLHHDAYLGYVQLRTGDHEAAASIVDAVLAQLGADWHWVLRSPCPAAVAWRLLGWVVDRRCCCCPAHPPARAVYGLLDREEADVLLLHRLLGLSVTRTAFVMGVDRITVWARLRAAERSLTPCLADHFGTCLPGRHRGSD